ncbi:MAG: hypothetical protein GX601_13865, partial [Anaerolineales bacterium]|nr:hypothetical protein [Anaerolineales bacterium]
MQGNRYRVLTSTRYHDAEAQRLMRGVAIAHGLLYTAGFALTVWGYDTVALSRIRAELAWDKLVLGMPLLLAIGALAGAIAGRRHHAGLSIGVWAAAGGLIGLIAGWVPFNGCTLITWLTEPRLRGLPIYPMEVAAQTRMGFTAVITAAFGVAVGLIGHLLVERAWDEASPDGHMTIRSWA